jgi:hypothetical protein
MDKAARAEQKIKAHCNRLGITDGGRQWLDVALDPFKDITQRPIGYPDAITSPSVVQAVHDSITIAAPSGVVGNWDANIFLDTLWRQDAIRATTKSNNNMFDSTGQSLTGYPRGGLVVRSAASGTSLVTSTTQPGIPYVIDVFDNDTSARIIAIGLEVHNTTAELHKQGSVTTYRVFDEPHISPVIAWSGAAAATNNHVAEGYELIEPPLTNGQALDLPGSLQWDAAKGVYVVPRFMESVNEPQDLRLLIPFADENSTGVTYTHPITKTGVNNIWLSTGSNNAHIPFSLAGAFFTGLSVETTLVCNLTYYIEQFPSIDSALRRVAGPSCVEDFAALELYTKVSRYMPTGVEVNDNFLGAFVAGIARVVSMVAPYVPRIINAISGAVEVVDTIQRTAGNDRQLTQPQRESKAIVPYKPQQEILVRDNRNGSRDVVISKPQPPIPNRHIQTTQKSHRPAGQTAKNKRNKDYNRLNKYIKASDAGNRYIM